MNTITLFFLLIVGVAIAVVVRYVWQRMKLAWYCKVLLFVALLLYLVGLYLSLIGYVNAAGLFTSLATVAGVSEELIRRRQNKRAKAPASVEDE